MKRRLFLSSTMSGVLLTGCMSDGGSPDTQTTQPTSTQTDTTTEPTPDYDVVVTYTTHVQEGASGGYDLPDPTYDDWAWLVLDLEVVEGELSMQDVWFNAFFETSERLYDVAHASSEVEDGVESRGSIREGGRGVVLHEYPPSPRGGPVGWNTSVMDQSVGGEGIIRDAPGELYPPVTVEYAVETAPNPGVLPDEYAERRDDGEVWAVVSIDVTEGHLNMEDIWFRSRLVTESRRHQLSHSSPHAERGVWSRGMVKPGNTAHALYLIEDDEAVEEWGYTEDARQEVTISRA